MEVKVADCLIPPSSLCRALTQPLLSALGDGWGAPFSCGTSISPSACTPGMTQQKKVTHANMGVGGSKKEGAAEHIVLRLLVLTVWRSHTVWQPDTG